MSNIFSQIKVKRVNFSNRIVMAPMVHFGYKNKNGNMEEKLLNTYLNYADKGIGLIISQALLVADKKEIVGDVSNWAGIYSNEHIEYLRKISDTYHKYGTKFIAQLNTLNFKFLEKNSNDINRLSKEDLIYLRDCFIKSAKFCQEAGLDGIELHGAHTYFFNMLSSEISNKREDNYGGNLIERLNLVKEIIEAIKSFSKDDFIISYRMGWTENINTDIETAKALEKLGVDILHVSSGIPEDRKLKLPNEFEYNDFVYTGIQVKKNVNIPVIVVNDIKTLSRGNKLIEDGDCDFVAYGRPFLSNPNFVIHSLK